MTRIQRQALRELKQRNKYHQRCERERSRHTQSLPSVAVAWISCYFVCAAVTCLFSAATITILLSA